MIVVADVDASRDIVISGSGSPTAPNQLRIHDSSNGDVDRIYNNTRLLASDSSRNDESIYFAFINGPDGDGYIRRNGAKTASGAVGQGSVDQLCIGDGIDYSDAFEGECRRVFFYDRELTASEIDGLESYLSTKWGLGLS